MDDSRSSPVESAGDISESRRGSVSDALLGSSEPREPPADDGKRRLLYALPALLLCQFIIRFDGSYMIGNYSQRIAVSLHEFNNARWLVLGFLVTESSSAPLYGHAAQVYGHRNSFLFAASMFSLGLFLCSLSHKLWHVALSRVIVGAGSAGIELLTVVVINDLVHLHELPLWSSAIIFCGTIGLMLGSPIGAAMTDRFGFRLTFGLEFCAMALTLVILYFTLPLHQKRPSNSAHTVQKIEYLSAGLLLISVATPLFALNLGGEVIPWNHPVMIILLGVTPILFVAFYYADTKLADTPIVPQRFIRHKYIAIVLGCTLPMKFVFDQLRFSFGTYLAARSFSNGSAFSDWALTCIYFGRALGTIVSGILVRRYRGFKIFLQLNILVDLVLYLCLSLGLIHPEQAEYAPVLTFIGATEGFAEGLWLVALLSLVEPGDQALLYAFFGMAMALSGDLGIAISLAAEGTLVRARLVAKLVDYKNAEEIIRKSLEDLNYIRQLPADVQSKILDALIFATQAAFGISFAVLIISLVFSVYVKEMSRSRTVHAFIS